MITILGRDHRTLSCLCDCGRKFQMLRKVRKDGFHKRKFCGHQCPLYLAKIRTTSAKAIAMLKAGVKQIEVARDLGVSRQRIHQIKAELGRAGRAG